MFSQEDIFYQKLKFNLKGKVKILDSITTYNDVMLHLVNENKKIIFSKKPEKDGSFIFRNLKSKVNYQVYYELENKDSKVKIEHKKEELVPLPKANISDLDAIGRRKRLVPDMSAPTNGVGAYNYLGQLIKPKGYGVFVGAFENINNVDLLVKKLLKDGYKDIVILVSYTDILNHKFKFSRNFKIHRVYVGEYNREKHAQRVEEGLFKKGYDTFVSKYEDDLLEKKVE
jgi:hypothetical protein